MSGTYNDGDCYDSDDLEDKFGDRPGGRKKIAAIKKNCRQVWNKETECNNYIVHKMTTRDAAEDVHEEGSKRSIEQQDDKFKKAEKIIKPEDAPVIKAKPCTAPQRKKLEKLSAKLKECKEKGIALLKHLDTKKGCMSSFIPAPVLNDFRDKAATALAEAIAVEMPLTEGWAGDFKEVFDLADAAAIAFAKSYSRMETFMAEYANMFGSSA